MKAREFIPEALPTVTRLGPQLYAPNPKQMQESLALKPRAARWTSTAQQTEQGWTSAWVKWAQAEMPNWVGGEGIVYDVAPGAKILSINSDRDAIRVAKHYGVEINSVIDLFEKMPWQAVANDYDAVHHQPSGGGDMYMSTWDVESTAWFDSSSLIRPRRVGLVAADES